MNVKGTAQTEYASLSGKIHSLVIDKSLTISGACADAKAVGDAIYDFDKGVDEAKEAYDKAVADLDKAFRDAAYNLDGYTRSETLTDDTKEKLGLGANAVPNDAFAWLGKYNQHWWSCLHGEAGVGYREVKTQLSYLVGIGGFVVTTGVKKQTIQYANEVSVNQETGGVTLVNPQDFVVDGTNLSTSKTTLQNLAALAPVYITTYDSSGIYYLPKGTTQAATSNTTTISCNEFDNGCYSISMNGSSATIVASAVTSEVYNIPAGETTYAHSADRNAYPDGGVVDGITYAYLGIPFNNAVTAPKIETGSYVGTGTYGADSPNTLTFGFEPKLILVDMSYTASTASNIKNAARAGLSVFFSGRTAWLTDKGASNTQYTTWSGICNVTCTGNTVSWYSAGNAYANGSEQLNESGKTYKYIAIG